MSQPIIEIVCNDQVLPHIEHCGATYYAATPGDIFQVRYYLPTNLRKDYKYGVELTIDGKSMNTTHSHVIDDKYILC